jgi:hypothetical protein
MVSLDEFRYIPAETATFRLVGRQSGVTELEKDGGVKSLVRVDEGTGVVLRHVMVGGDGVPIRCVIQDNVVTYPGGVAFPTLAVSGMFGPDGRLRSASLRGRLESSLSPGSWSMLPSGHEYYRGLRTQPQEQRGGVYIAMIHRMSRFDPPEKNKDDDLLRRPRKAHKP